jgi:DNA-binding XRE family transcriptional regulator
MVDIIERNGKSFAIMPLSEYRHLLEAAQASAAPQPPIAGEPNELSIRSLREHRGLTQQALASAVGIARPYLTEIETGKKQGSIGVLKALAKALDVELAAIA